MCNHFKHLWQEPKLNYFIVLSLKHIHMGTGKYGQINILQRITFIFCNFQIYSAGENIYVYPLISFEWKELTHILCTLNHHEGNILLTTCFQFQKFLNIGQESTNYAENK